MTTGAPFFFFFFLTGASPPPDAASSGAAAAAAGCWWSRWCWLLFGDVLQMRGDSALRPSAFALVADGVFKGWRGLVARETEGGGDGIDGARVVEGGFATRRVATMGAGVGPL